MVEELTDSIIAYIHYVKEQHNLSITLHDLTGNTRDGVYRLLPFNTHRNPYCLFVKSNQALWNHCARRQFKILEKVKRHGMIIGECFCGVKELVFPLNTLGNVTVGFLCVSGYRSQGDESLPRLTACTKKYGFDLSELLHVYHNCLSPHLPDIDFVQIIIDPLRSMYSVLEYHVNLLSPKKNYVAGHDYNRGFGRIIQYVDRNYNMRLKVSDIAKAFNCSESHINHLFKKFCGFSFNQYINRLRIDAAKCLLESVELKIWEIAQSVGFFEPNYFCSVFKKETGYSPSEYRAQYVQK